MKKDRYTYNFIIFKNGKKVTKLERIGMLSRFFGLLLCHKNMPDYWDGICPIICALTLIKFKPARS